MKQIILCADDYGQSESISASIIHLIKANRLSATSCLVNFPDWVNYAKWLSPLKEKVDIGLHFNLTEGLALSPLYQAAYGAQFFSVKKAILHALFGRYDQQVIEAELIAQIEQFRQARGVLPDFIDGHHHVHQFPVIRAAVMNVYRTYFPEKKCYIRLSDVKLNWGDRGLANLKKLTLIIMGSLAFKKRLIKNHIPFNSSFSGMYDFNLSTDYRSFFLSFLGDSRSNGLIMCHPAQKNNERFRLDEFLYLNGDQFLDDCARNQILLKRFSFNQL